jgi:hypothetical protein
MKCGMKVMLKFISFRSTGLSYDRCVRSKKNIYLGNVSS